MIPISINQIKDSVDLNCITPPVCRSFKNDMEAFIDDYCELKESVDITGLTSECNTVPGTYTLKDILQLLLSNCSTTPALNLDEELTTLISGLNLCNSDGWQIGDNNCIVLLDNCGNPITEYTIKEIIQLLIRRMIAIEEELTLLHTLVLAKETQINTLISRVDLIEQNCCNVTVVNQLGTLNTRVTNVEDSITDIQADITDIQTNCC